MIRLLLRLSSRCAPERLTAWTVGIFGWLIAHSLPLSADSFPARTLQAQTTSASPAIVRQRKIPPILRFSPKPYHNLAHHPPRHLRLVNGDLVTAEILDGDHRFVVIRVFGDQRMRIPLTTLESVAALPGERELVNESFNEASHLQIALDPKDAARVSLGQLSIAAAHQSVSLAMPQTSEQIRAKIRFRVQGPEPLHEAAGIGWAWQFINGSRLQVSLDSRGRWQSAAVNLPEISTTQQPIAALSGWHTAQLRIAQSRVFISLDDQLLYAGPSTGSPLKSLELLAQQNIAAATRFQLDHLSLIEETIDSPEAVRTLLPQDDEILGAEGDSWWGQLQSIGPQGITWTNRQTTWQRRWPQLHGLSLRRAMQPVVGKPLAGHIVRLELQPSTDRPDLPGDHLTVALGPTEHGRLLVDHPLWGRLAVPRNAVRSLESNFVGEWRLLDAREIHFERSEHHTDPQQTLSIREIVGTMLLESVPQSAVYVSLDAAGLEPSGPETPPGSPLLNTLRSGQLVTELFVNQQRVGTFNELTSQWSLPSQFDRLRMRLPSQCLRTGENSWRISQTPHASSSTAFDDCQLRNISLEIEPALP